MLGVLVYRLRVETGGHFTLFPGRLLHGALFHYLSERSAELSADFHARQIKPFTIGCLQRADRRRAPSANAEKTFNEPAFTTGESVFLRVTALDDAALMALAAMPRGTRLQVGKLAFSLEEVLADGRMETGAAAPDELAAAALSMERARSIRLHFRSPTLFRADGYDYAFPQPERIFASLADKWTQQELPAVIYKDAARIAAAKLVPLAWRGESLRVRLTNQKRVPAFVGDFSFSLAELSEEEREIILLLTQFAPFCGTGRMTAQGMGETYVSIS